MLLIINVELFNLNLEPTIKRIDCYSFKNKIQYVYLWNNTAFGINSISEVYTQFNTNTSILKHVPIIMIS